MINSTRQFLMFAGLLALPASESRGQEWSPLSTVPRANFNVSAEGTQFTTLDLHDIPAGTTLRITCIGNGCPFRSKSITYASAKSDLSLAEFSQSKLKPGARITVRVTAPNTIGKVFEWQVQNGKSPSLTASCIAPGSAKPLKC